MNLNGLHREPTTYKRPIYGSSRLGILNKYVEFDFAGNFLSKSNSTIGIKEYELSDHLGNVSVVILDRKNSLSTDIQPIIISNTDYYPFGYPISFRTHSIGYRYGFNGQEGDGEIYGDKLNYAFQYRMYDARIGRFWSVDPLTNIYSNWSSYAFAFDNPILNIELEGLEGVTNSHRLYFQKAGIQLFNIYRNEIGLSRRGAAFALAQSALESSYGNLTDLERKIAANNYWGLKNGGKLLHFATFRQGLDSYKKNMAVKWPNAFNILKKDEFSNSDINEALHTSDFKILGNVYCNDPGDYAQYITNMAINVLGRMSIVLQEEIDKTTNKANKLIKSVDRQGNNIFKNSEDKKIYNDLMNTIQKYKDEKTDVDETIKELINSNNTKKNEPKK